MQIVNLLGRESRDIKVPLRLMAESDDPLTAAKGERLLELVRRLEAQGPAPCVTGLVSRGQLWLNAHRPHPRVSVRVWVDWPDYGPVQDGLPLVHYRIQADRPGSPLTTDARARSPEEVEPVLWKAFGLAR